MAQSKWLPRTIVVVLLTSSVGVSAAERREPSTVPVEIHVPIVSAPVLSNDRLHLLYEIHITNLRSRDLVLTRVDIADGGPGGRPLASYAGSELGDRIDHPGISLEKGAEVAMIPGGTRVVVFVQIEADSNQPPRTLDHRLAFSSTAAQDAEERVVEVVGVRIDPIAPVILGSPLRGGAWLAGNGLSNDSDHRRTLIPLGGQARIAQRYAVDWVKLGPDGRVANGDPSINANWYGYGVDVLAVADAVVVDVMDGVPENVPLTGEMAVSITLATIGGNYVILDLGQGRFVFYAHLQPGSIRVAVGDRVRAGQTLGLLGNSGNSDAPHLHLHVADSDSPLAAEGLPFSFASHVVLGQAESIESLVEGEPWVPRNAASPRHGELPVSNAVLRFP